MPATQSCIRKPRSPLVGAPKEIMVVRRNPVIESIRLVYGVNSNWGGSAIPLLLSVKTIPHEFKQRFYTFSPSVVMSLGSWNDESRPV
jgi:hypothetical protein